MASRSTKLSPAWVLTVVTADSFLLLPNNMFHSLNSIVTGTRAIPSSSAEASCNREPSWVSFCLDLKRFWWSCAGRPQPGSLGLEAVSAAETGDPPSPCNEPRLHYFGRALVLSPLIQLNSKPPSERGGENPAVPAAARMRLLFLAWASPNVKVETPPGGDCAVSSEPLANAAVVAFPCT